MSLATRHFEGVDSLIDEGVYCRKKSVALGLALKVYKDACGAPLDAYGNTRPISHGLDGQACDRHLDLMLCFRPSGAAFESKHEGRVLHCA